MIVVMIKLMTPHELADLLGVPRHTLDQWAYLRVGPPYIKIGRHRRYDQAAVLEFLTTNTVPTRPAAKQ